VSGAMKLGLGLGLGRKHVCWTL